MRERILAIGDIHGCDVAWDALLQHLSPTASDTFILLGDVIDRGPNTRRVLDTILDLREVSNLVLLMGNHEEMLNDALEDEGRETRWLRWGGRETLASYGAGASGMPDAHRSLLASAEPYWETTSTIFVHASLEPEIPLEKQTAEWLRWQRLTGFEYPRSCGRRVVCGHSGVETGLPWVLDGWVCLDTLCYRGLWLTALDVENDTIHQANQNGELRYGVSLDDLR